MSRKRVDILSAEPFIEIKFGLDKTAAKRVGGRREGIVDFISGPLSPTEVLAKRGAAGRGFDSVTRGANSLNV